MVKKETKKKKWSTKKQEGAGLHPLQVHLMVPVEKVRVKANHFISRRHSREVDHGSDKDKINFVFLVDGQIHLGHGYQPQVGPGGTPAPPKEKTRVFGQDLDKYNTLTISDLPPPHLRNQ